jgi:hypothetical protein
MFIPPTIFFEMTNFLTDCWLGSRMNFKHKSFYIRPCKTGDLAISRIKILIAEGENVYP